MDTPSNSAKKQSIVILLPLLIMWAAGLWVFRKEGSSLAADAAVTAWYFLLLFIFLELFLLRISRRSGLWPAALSLLWAICSGMTDSQPLAVLFPPLSRIDGIYMEYLSAALTPLLLLSFFLSLKKENTDISRQLFLPGIALAAAACVWEPAKFTLSLCFLASALHAVSQGLVKAREETLCALSQTEILSELNRMKNRSYTDLSHEMKTPLTVISINAQLAAANLEAGVLDEETITDIRIISTEASRLTQMVTSLVGLGRLQGTGIGYSPLSIDTLVQATAHTYQALSSRHGNTLTVAAEPDLPDIYGNADHLTQVLINLISNANRHTRNGTISISIKDLTDWLEVCVTDNGEGIDPELLPHVFERFRRGDKGDTGLGLSICETIINEHGGKMGIESEIGKGTKVWFTLPVHKEKT